MKKILVVILVSFTIILPVEIKAQENQSLSQNQRKDGYVPNSETAIKIAEAVWLPIYGDKIYKNKPFIATLRDDNVWVVKGTLHTEKGGVPYVEIQKSDCRVLKVIHTK